MIALALGFVFLPVFAAQGAPDAAVPEELIPADWLVIAPVDGRGRRPFRPDAVFARYLLDSGAPPPKAGEELEGERGPQGWEQVRADEAGRVRGSIGYAWTTLEAERRGVWMADLDGASTLFVNGTGFVGDLYRYGFDGVPVVLAEGVNQIAVTGVRGGFSLRFWKPEGMLYLDPKGTVEEDYHGSDALWADAGLLVWSTTESPISRVHVHYGGLSRDPSAARVNEWRDQDGLAPLAPMQVSTWIDIKEDMTADGDGPLYRTLNVYAEGEDVEPWEVGDPLPIPVRSSAGAHRRVFRSRIDGSLQGFALLPPAGVTNVGRGLSAVRPMNVLLSLHGAGVDCLSQAQAYGKKSGWWILAPQNRRPFGFDWQDWGRTDAYEALDSVFGNVRVTLRVFLAGHSMGGHGAWHLAANDPDRFLAVAPSAGWASFDSYGGRPDGELRELWHAADAASDTLALLDNLAEVPVYVLHGEEDTNVPVTEARTLVEGLRERSAPVQVHYEPGAGHWWDRRKEPGADCVDWPGFFELFDSVEGAHPDELDWTSVDPGIDAAHHWLEATQARRYGAPMKVEASRDAEAGLVRVDTQNVQRLSLNPGEGLEVSLDGQAFDASARAFVRGEDGSWRVGAATPPIGEKRPDAQGPFKRAFDNRFLVVYGTAGDPREDRELFERGRHDLEVWWYRANGVPRFMSDEEYLAAIAEPELAEGEAKAQMMVLESQVRRVLDLQSRNVILYGNEDTNRAWRVLLAEDSPVQVRRGAIELGERVFGGEDLGVVFTYPSALDRSALVGYFADTGTRGARLGYTLASFVSGVGYPDYAVYSSEVLRSGDGGVLAAGWFDHAWGLQEEGSFLRAVSQKEADD